MSNRTSDTAIRLPLLLCWIVAAVLGLLAVVTLPAGAHAEAANTLYWDGAHLTDIRNSPDEYSKTIRRSLEQLEREADEALNHGPYSVVDKEIVPPSGNKHDYMSFSRYWWPNPDTPDGLPYVQRDGHVNRELLSQGDRVRIGEFYDDFETLTLAAYLIDAEKYAPHAMRLMRTWFIEPETRMNPNLKYGQAVPGRSDGRDVGIMDTRHFIRVLESVALLDELNAVTADDHKALTDWFGTYLEWLLTSDLGREERRADNNHGSWYAAQTAYIALFVEKPELARQIINEVRNERISSCIRPDGSQPEELERTRSLHYSLFNLSALFVCARLGEHVGVDLWDYKADSGASLARALNYVAPYVHRPDKWPYPEMDDFGISDRYAHVFYLARTRLRDADILEVLRLAPTEFEDQYFSPLLFPTDISQTKSTHGNGNKYTVSVIEDFTPEPLVIELPDLSGYTEEAIRDMVPSTSNGRARIAEASEFPLLEEAFRGPRGRDLRRRQGTDNARVIVVDEGVLSLEELVERLDDEKIAQNTDRVVTVRLPIMVSVGATLVIDGNRTPVLRLSTDRGAFLANAGRLFTVDATVTSWSEAAEKPTVFEEKSKFRPFISSYIRSETFIAGSTIQHLGFHAPTAYGFSLSSHPERHQGRSNDDWPTGMLVGNEFRGLYYGFYSFEARDVAIVNNRYVDCIVYGIDPHDRSTRLVIARNTATGTMQKHGIIGSRGISDSFICDNVSHHNAGSGIMLDRQCSQNVIAGNKVYKNNQGIAIYESPNNVICSNLIAFNTKSGVRIRNSVDVEVRDNTIVGNEDYALEVYSKRLDDHGKRVARGDLYDPHVEVVFFQNTVAGNRGLAKGNDLDRLRLAGIRHDVNTKEIAAQLRIRPSISTYANDRTKLGQELKQISSHLSGALRANDVMIEVRQADRR